MEPIVELENVWKIHTHTQTNKEGGRVIEGSNILVPGAEAFFSWIWFFTFCFQAFEQNNSAILMIEYITNQGNMFVALAQIDVTSTS